MPWLKLRTVCFTPDAKDEYKTASEAFPRFGEVWDGIVWLLARNPRPVESLTTTLNGVEYILYGTKGDPQAGTPEMWLVYTCDDDEVIMYGINVMEPADDPIESEEEE